MNEYVTTWLVVWGVLIALFILVAGIGTLTGWAVGNTWIEDMWATRKVRRYYRRQGYKRVRPARYCGELQIRMEKPGEFALVEPRIPTGMLTFIEYGPRSEADQVFEKAVASGNPRTAHDGSFYFWDETWSTEHGPYTTESERDQAVDAYLEQL
jgi:hypothetical protein